MSIRWPERFEPSRCPIHVRNELTMSAPAAAVWGWLVRAEAWPEWYANASDVTVEGPSAPDLSAGTRFRWRTFGVSLVSTVEEFVPGERIAWHAVGRGIDAYHAWLIEPLDSGCRVLTEETQHGWLARLGKLLMPSRMHRQHQAWLEGIQAKAVAGSPPGGKS